MAIIMAISTAISTAISMAISTAISTAPTSSWNASVSVPLTYESETLSVGLKVEGKEQIHNLVNLACTSTN